MKIVSAAEMREIDRVTSERFGVPSLHSWRTRVGGGEFVLIALSGGATYRRHLRQGKQWRRRIGRRAQAARSGEEVRNCCLAEPSELRGDAAEMLDRLAASPAVARSWEELLQPAPKAVFDSELLIDAILGTGFKPPVSGVYAEAIRQLNASSVPVIAVDIPSGVDADSMSAPAGTLPARMRL